MGIKRKLTEVAVDSFTDYLKEKFEKLKQLDLDTDGHKDVDQIVEILTRCGTLTKEALRSTNFPQLGAGLEQIFSGSALLKDAVDTKTLGAAGQELGQALIKLGQLAHLGVIELKESGNTDLL